jgi:hypothetical protein
VSLLLLLVTPFFNFLFVTTLDIPFWASSTFLSQRQLPKAFLCFLSIG